MIPIPEQAHKARLSRTAATCLLVVLLPVLTATAEVTHEQVQNAVRKAVANLRNSQAGDGTWKRYGSYEGGNTALAALALINAGISPNDPAVAKAVAAVAKTEDKYTYVVSLKCQLLAAADPEGKKYRPQLQKAVNWLAANQLANGMWTYRQQQNNRFAGRGDNSNTQFALLGLHEAAKAGALVPPKLWRLSRIHFTNTQLKDGGWTYHYQQGRNARMANVPSYGSMTAAGVASLYICGQRLHVTGPKTLVNGAWPSCGRYRHNVPIAKGLEWLTDNFAVRENPGRRTGWLHYYLYALERVGMISGQQTFGRHDWYRKGAAFLVDTQDKDGSWGRMGYDTAFGLLFLAKGNRPVIVQKLLWGPAEKANRNIHDLENLTIFLDDKLGQHTTWQSVSVSADLADWRLAPILFITGHEFPEFTDRQEKQLKAFVESGGTIFAEACCGSDPFAAGLRKLTARLWPEYPLRALPKNHPVFASYYDLEETFALEGMDVGCRTGLFFAPRAVSALWEMQDLVQDGRNLSEQAFKLGTNMAAYATGREQLSAKLDRVDLGGADQDDPNREIPRGAVRIARIYHTGDYQADRGQSRTSPRCSGPRRTSTWSAGDDTSRPTTKRSTAIRWSS
ncbi:MAG: DUF4159 domain-containing protein [Planctomycetota bacterium]